jgi:hypothetical protein
MTDHAHKAAEQITWHLGSTNQWSMDVAVPIIAQAIAEHSQKLGNQLEAVAGALADAGNAFTTTDHAECVRELTRERDWFALLARASLMGVVRQSQGQWWLWVNTSIGSKGIDCKSDANGLPVESPELRAALEAAMKE